MEVIRVTGLIKMARVRQASFLVRFRNCFNFAGDGTSESRYDEVKL